MSVTDPEHSFGESVVISGDELRGYTAGEDLAQGEPVAITGDYEVTGAASGGPAIGLATTSVTAGEELTIAGDDCEVRVETSEAVNAGVELTPDGLGTVRQTVEADPDVSFAVTNESAGSGELVEAYISVTSGVTA